MVFAAGKRSQAGLLAVLLLAVLAAYANHFQNSFHFDDGHAIVDNPAIRTLDVSRFFTDPTAFSVLPANRTWRPVITTSLAIDYKLGGGLNPAAFHISTFVWFAAQLVLMYFLFERAFAFARPDGNSVLWGLFGTLLYGLHPACAETINYIIQRGDLYSTLAVIAGLYLYIAKPSWRKYGVYLVPVAAGLLSKPPALVFPAILIVWLVLFEKQTSLQALRAAIPALLLSILSAVVQVKMTPPSYTTGAYSAGAYLLTQPYVWLRYFVSFFLPTHLSADTDLNTLVSAAQPEAVEGFLFAAAIAGGAWWFSRRQSTKPIGFGLWWFILALLPTSIFPLAEVENDHRMFFPFVGLAMSLAWALAMAIPARIPKVAVARALGAVLLLFAYGTRQRNEVWRDEASLWKDVVDKSPRNGRGWMNYGLTLMSTGDLEGAVTSFRRASEFTPNYPLLDVNLGIALGAQGKDAEAEQHFQRALTLGPNDSGPHAYYARWLDSKNRTPEAEAQARDALRLNPLDPQAKAALDNIEGRPKVAEKAAETNPTPEHYLNLSLRYHQQGRYEDCIRAAKEAIALNPNYAEAYNNIAAAYQSMEKWDEAIVAARKAIALKPDFQLARNNLAWSESKKNSARH